MDRSVDYVAVPPGPRCERCGHMMCPCCGNWCDTLVFDEDGEYGDLCCDGECRVSEYAVQRWLAQVATVRAKYPTTAIVVAQGPIQRI